MEKLDITLTDYFLDLEVDDRVEKAKLYALDILSGLEWLHRRNILFCDIKPDNFMLIGDALKFIDFGLVQLSGHSTTKNVAGTPEFFSLRVSQGEKYRKIDDVESLMYLILYVCSTKDQLSLPWSDAEDNQEMIELKEDADLKKLCKKRDIPELYKLIKYCRNFEEGDEIDYDMIFERLR